MEEAMFNRIFFFFYTHFMSLYFWKYAIVKNIIFIVKPRKHTNYLCYNFVFDELYTATCKYFTTLFVIWNLFLSFSRAFFFCLAYILSVRNFLLKYILIYIIQVSTVRTYIIIFVNSIIETITFPSFNY